MKNNSGIAKFVGLALLAFLLAASMPGAGWATNRISWHGFDEGIAKGKQEGKKIYINFYSDLCQYCEVMEKKTFVDPSVVSYLGENFIAIRINSDREKKLADDFRVRGLPDNWFMKATGEVIGHRPGYIPPDTFFKILQSVQNTDTE